MTVTKKLSFPDYLKSVRLRIDASLNSYLIPETEPPEILNRAVRYSVFAGGKRLRPALVLLACDACGGNEEEAIPAACAAEMVHTYSLIHDDLPCMDNSDLRRGKPTCHKVFGDANAVLAGDALLTEAFGVLAKTPNPKWIPELVKVLAAGAGAQGMVAGQVLDLEAVGKKPTLAGVEKIHLGKTAALFASCLEMGAICAQATTIQRSKIREFGLDLGLAFQIVDDVLDETGDEKTLGKTAGQDQKSQKVTYPACVGVEKARSMARSLAERAQSRLHSVSLVRAERFFDLAAYVVERIS